MLRNGHWYTQNASRPYPIDDTASAIGDDGTPLPSDIIVDLILQFPEAAGEFAFISAVTATTGIVTVTILACRAPAVETKCLPEVGNDDLDFTPLAAISLVKPIEVGRPYLLDSLYPGAGGTIVFGPGIDQGDEPVTVRFSTPAQSLLAPRAASWYEAPPVTGVRKLYQNTDLTGIVRLAGGTDVEVVGEVRDIRGELFDTIVVRLRDKSDVGGRNIFEEYKGPCGARPESDTCGDPAPIEFINTVSPDCCGNITLEFFGCGDIIQLTGDFCGGIVDCGIGVIDACVDTDVLPDSDGNLPNEYESLCESFSEVSEYVAPSPGGGTPPEYSTPAESTEPDIVLPYIENFDDEVADAFIIKRGGFGFVGNDSPDEEDELGPELVTNGDFSAGTNVSTYGWTTDNHDGEIDTANDWVLLPYDQDGGGGASSIEKSVTVEAGETYRVQFQLISVVGGIQVTIEDGVGTLSDSEYGSEGLWVYEATPTDTTLTLRFAADDGGDTAFLDSISVRKITAAEDGSESYTTVLGSAPITRCVAVWQPSHPGWTSYYKMCEVNVLMQSGQFGTSHNAAVVINLRDSEANPGRNEYWVAEIDWDGQFVGQKAFRVAHYDGYDWTTLGAVHVPDLELNAWYEIRASVFPVTGQPTAAWIVATLTDVVGGAVDVSIDPIYVEDWSVADGLFGIGANEAAAAFSYFKVDNALGAP